MAARVEPSTINSSSDCALSSFWSNTEDTFLHLTCLFLFAGLFVALRADFKGGLLSTGELTRLYVLTDQAKG
jgi:hypothetical protein